MKHLIHTLKSLLAHYQTKLLLAFLLCAIIPICITGLISYKLSYEIAAKQITESATSSANLINMQLNSRISQEEQVSDTLQYNMYTLLQSNKREKTSYIDIFTKVRNDIYLYKSSFHFYHIYVFLNEQQFGSDEALYFVPVKKLSDFNISLSDLSNIGASSLWKYSKNIVLPYILDPSDEPINGMICCRAQVNQGSQSLDYAFMLIIDIAEINDILQYTDNDSVHTYLMSQDGTIITNPSNNNDIELTLSDVTSHLETQTSMFRKDSSAFYCLPLNNGWYQVTEIPEEYISTSTNALLKWIVLALFFSISLTIIIVLFIVRSLSKRINGLSLAMNEYQLDAEEQTLPSLDFKRPKNIAYYDEIDTLSLSFEKMRHSIQSNLHSIVDYKIREERLKYQLLQSQINPHFLYNILGSIQTCQSLGKLDVASQMITDLTKFYRLSLRKSGELISLRDELEIAVSYLNIEKLCHNNIVDWNIELEEGIENFAICKFTLQPFLENSILHGISENTPNIHIDISAVYGDSTVIITIKDNGIGIPPDKLQEIQSDLAEKSIHYDKHFGICNVNVRIANKYYGDGTIKIDSIPNHGTTVIIEYSQIEV